MFDLTHDNQEISLRLRNDVHVLRKLWHSGCGLIGAYLYFNLGLSQKEWVPILLSLAFLSLSLEIARLRFKFLNHLVLLVMGPFMRASERDSISGMPFYALGVGLALAFFEEKIAILSILFLIFADPISSYVGIKFGKTKILPNKSLEGSLAGVCVCSFITLLYGYYYGASGGGFLLFVLLAGFIGSISEFVSQRVDDNLTIPIISGLGLSILNGLIPLF